MTITLAATQSIAGVAGTGSAINYTLFGDEITAGVDAFKAILQGTLPTSATVLYTATGVQTIVKGISLQNVTAGAVTVSIHVNGTANTNKIWSGTIPANGSATYDGKWTVYDASGYAQTAGATGPTGITGAAGRDAGIKYTYSTNTALTDPGAGFLKFDNATLASITNFRISETDGDANGIAALIATWANSTSTNRTTITIVKDAAPSNTLVFQVTGALTDQGTWDSMPITFVSSSGTLANNDVVKVFFSRTGDKGDTGNTGAPGAVNAITAGAGLAGSGTSTVTLDVNVDNSTIEIPVDTLQMKDGGTTNAKLANMAESGTGLVKGRAVGAGTGAPQDLTRAQVKAIAEVSGTNSGDVTLTAAGASPNANAASLSGQALTLQPASASFPGNMSAADFSKLAAITGSHTGNQSGTNTGDITLTAVGASPNANAASLAGQALTLQPASSSFPGLMSILDKKIVDDLHYDVVADFGWIGNDLNDNGAGAGGATPFSGVTSIMSQLPTGARLFFPAGTYRTSVELTIGVDKRITFQGVGRYASIIKTTSTTANIFHKTVAGWYDTWMDLGFQSSVTKTNGSCIHISSANSVGMNVYRCWMTGIFKGIHAVGSQSANLSVWADLDISGIANNGRGIVIDGDTINVMIHNTTINAGAATNSACCEIIQSGAVQVTASDWIQGTNVLLINSIAGAGAGPQACYFTNCFFDQPQASVIKIVGTRTANRIKFTQCGIATGHPSAAGNHGIEIAGTGAGGVGTQTALPAGISIVDCDIYHQNIAGSAASGIFLNGVGDVNIQNTRITGYSLSGGCGIQVTPSASNQTKLRVNGCIIGPNSNLTVTNETGIKINAGTMGFLSITDNTLLGMTTAINDASTILNTVTKNINNNQGGAAGLTAQATAGGTLTTTTETAVPGLQIYFPPNSIKVGTTIQWNRADSVSATTTTIEKIRFGVNGTTGDATNLSSTTAASGAAAQMIIQGSVTFTSVGAAGAFVGAVAIAQAAVAGAAPAVTITGTVNTTVGNFATVTVQNGTANTRTFRGGQLFVLSPA